MKFFIFFFLYSIWASSATIAIIDTGFDLDHDFLRPKLVVDGESPIIRGKAWPIYDNSHLKAPIISEKSLVQEILLYRSLKAKSHKEGLTIDEFEWLKKKNNDPDFLKEVKKFKKHAHGTFVAGIALREGDNIQVVPIRGLNLPSKVVAVSEEVTSTPALAPVVNPDEKFKQKVEASIKKVTNKFDRLVGHIASKKIEIVNASYGINFYSVQKRFKEKYKEITGKEIDENYLKTIITYYFDELFKKTSTTIQKYPHLLFVFSAGNNSLNNDEFPHYPSKLKFPNTLSVAALNGDYLASFSNYGKLSVDIAAPGVGILSLVPKVYSESTEDLYSPASGTSMAAPFISNLAAQILNLNPLLKPEEIKKIILDTGDNKPYLSELLLSGSLVNNQRALKAALLSKGQNLNEAINLAKSDLILTEDKLNITTSPPVAPEEIKAKILNSIPTYIPVEETDDVTTSKEVPPLPLQTQ